MTSGGCEVDVGGRGPTAKTTHRITRSSTVIQQWTLDLSMIETATALILTGKKLEYRSLPPYIHLASTHMNAPSGGGLGTRLLIPSPPPFVLFGLPSLQEIIQEL